MLFLLQYRIFTLRQDLCQYDADKCGKRQSGDRYGAVYRNAVAADTEYEDDSCDHQVAAVTEVQTLIYDNTHTDGRDHSVQYDGNTADDRARDARDDCSDLSENTEQDRKDLLQYG